MEAAPPPSAPLDYHLHLSRRAEAFIRGAGGAVPEERLIGHVFGTTGSMALWRPLLQQILAATEVVRLRADGHWAIAESDLPDAETALGEFVALDVETTGLRPLHQRIIEVAAIRYQNGAEVARYTSLLNPDKRIPKYIVSLTGIDNEMVDEAPRFPAIADDLVDFLGSSLIIGHNVRFDLAFVNAELKRLGRLELINDRLDTLPLAVKLVPGLRRPSLQVVAEKLGVQPESRRLHRAMVDAALTAGVALRLAERARQEQIVSLGQLQELAAPARRLKDGRPRGRAPLDRSLLNDIPKAPGVYLMRDAFDHVVYIGKAKNLRDRVSSYFSQPLGYTRKMDGLLESLVRIDVEVVGSELEALLLESQLIGRYQPRYNTAMRAFEHYPFIRVDVSGPWPRLTLAKGRKDDGARYFGPFRNKSGARTAVDLINRTTPLRTCSRSFRDARSYGSPCLELDLGRCMGPCVGRADRDEYMALVRDVVSFLDGQDDALRGRLWTSLEDAAARLDFERAGRLRKDLQSVEVVVAAQRGLREAFETHHALVVLPSPDPQAREVLLVVRGRLWAQVRAFRRLGVPDLTARLDRSWGRLTECGIAPPAHDTVDAINILNRWLHHHAGHAAILPLKPPPLTPDWEALGHQVFRLTDSDLVVDTRTIEVPEGSEDSPADILLTSEQRALVPAP